MSTEEMLSAMMAKLVGLVAGQNTDLDNVLELSGKLDDRQRKSEAPLLEPKDMLQPLKLQETLGAIESCLGTLETQAPAASGGVSCGSAVGGAEGSLSLGPAKKAKAVPHMPVASGSPPRRGAWSAGPRASSVAPLVVAILPWSASGLGRWVLSFRSVVLRR